MQDSVTTSLTDLDDLPGAATPAWALAASMEVAARAVMVVMRFVMVVFVFAGIF